MNILEALWYGNIEPFAQCQYRTQEFRELVELYEQNEKRLTVTLNPGQKEDLQKMKDVAEEMQQLTECGAFLAGFRLATQIMTAALRVESA